MRDFSPEERLLRLIRSKGAKSASADLPVDKIKKDLGLEKVPRKRLLARSRLFKWEALNLILVILLIGLSLYFAHNFLKRPKGIIASLDERLSAQGPQTEAGSPSLEKRPSVDYFLGGVGARNIFLPVFKEEAQPQTPVEEGPKMEEIKAQLSLLGIISGVTPQAIIEDKRTQKTYFLNKGSTFDDIEVGDILENKVILIYKGRQFELAL